MGYGQRAPLCSSPLTLFCCGCGAGMGFAGNDRFWGMMGCWKQWFAGCQNKGIRARASHSIMFQTKE